MKRRDLFRVFLLSLASYFGSSTRLMNRMPEPKIMWRIPVLMFRGGQYSNFID